MKELIGKTILGLAIAEGEVVLELTTTVGILRYVCDGDCCSETWFADIINPECLLGQEIIAVYDVDLANYNSDDGRCRQEVDEVYGHKLVTSKGCCDIIYRNSSNGYYGGDCFLDIADEYSTTATMTSITTDWEAQ